MRGEDRLSALPDELIHRILSFLLLHEVIATSILSSRWRYLWTSVPTLHLSGHPEDGLHLSGDPEDIATSISLSLINYKSPKINKFLAEFNVDYVTVTDHHIASWIRFAVDRSVEELHLLLDDDPRGRIDIPHYKVLRCVSNCRSLKVLRLRCCEMNLKSSPLCLPLLTMLELNSVKLSCLDTSGCPALESITLYKCNWDEHLNIYASNPSLEYLMIKEGWYHDRMLTIHAPNVQSVHINWSPTTTYIIKDLSSLRRARLELESERFYREEAKLFLGLLSVLHAPTLNLSRDCILVLSDLSPPEAGLKFPPLRSICLELDICLEKSYQSGMAHVMRNAPHLTTLILNVQVYPPSCKDALDACDFVSAISSLKAVEVNFIIRGQSMPSRTVDEFFNNWEVELKLLELLLNSCTVLEKMTISIIKGYSSDRKRKPWPLESGLLLALEKKVLAFPKASSIAEICFPQKPVIV